MLSPSQTEAGTSPYAKAYLLMLDVGLHATATIGRRFLIPKQGLVLGNDITADVSLAAPLHEQEPYRIRIWHDPTGEWRFRLLDGKVSISVNHHQASQGNLLDGCVFQVDQIIFEFLLETGPKWRVYQEMENRIRIDHLTRILNRRGIVEQTEREMARLAQDPSNAFSIVLLNLDHFADINQQHGYLCGDETLKEVVRRAQSSLRKQDILGRYGGEEFLILLPQTHKEEAIRLTKLLQNQVQNQPVRFGEQSIPITLSAGLATAKQPTSFQHILQLAEDHLALAKKAGRNRIAS